MFGTALLGPFSRIVVWVVWTDLMHVADPTGAHRNRLVEGDSISPLWALVPVPYLLVPWSAGSVAGKMRNRYFGWIVRDQLDASTQEASAPTGRLRRRLGMGPRQGVPINLSGWDLLFLDRGPKLVAVRLRDGLWIAGVFGTSSFSSPSSAAERELVLESRVEIGVDGVIPLDDLDTPNEIGGSVRVSSSDVDLTIVNRS